VEVEIPVPDHEALFATLARLDRRLERAIAAADAVYGPAAASDPYRGLYVSGEDAQRSLAREPGASPLGGFEGDEDLVLHPPLRALSEAFGLASFDADAVVIALAPELDLRYERLYAYLQDDVTRRRPSVDLILNLLCATRTAKVDARARFAPDAPLVRHRLVHLVADGGAGPPPLLSQSVKLDDAVVRHLLGRCSLDPRVAPFARRLEPPAAGPLPPTEPVWRAVADLARQAQAAHRGFRVSLEGPPGAGRRAAAQAIANGLGASVIEAALGQIPPADFEPTIALLLREARLQGALLLLEDLDALHDTERAPQLRALLNALRDSPLVTVLAGQRPWPPAAGVVSVPLLPLDFGRRREAWAAELAAHQLALEDRDLEDLARGYRLTRDQIADAVACAVGQSGLQGAAPRRADLAAAARQEARPSLGPLARRVTPIATWDDIVLPPDSLAQLKDICHHARFRHVVFDDWGFDRKLSLGKGLSALFSGPPGTGKTMAAEVIANELGFDLYKIDLSSVVSKYIGETEKNLNRVFAESRDANVILLFDECDALFGKRTEVRDAHDRYANIEVAYLLQKMDEHDGLSILATNLRQNLDGAFTRRLTFTVEFPFPDEESRRHIWRAIWPSQLPRAPGLDLDFMASQFKLSGGGVKNVALSAAFLAAAAGAGEVRIEHLLRATRRELEKSGRSVSRAEFGRYGEALATGANGDGAS
jgi:hypothetical protein